MLCIKFGIACCAKIKIAPHELFYEVLFFIVINRCSLKKKKREIGACFLALPIFSYESVDLNSQNDNFMI